MADKKLSLNTLKPAATRKNRKRVGRGLGSGKGRYSGRGIKGQKSRSGSAKMPPGFEGGQMPLDMRAPKLPRQAARLDLEGRDAGRPAPHAGAGDQRPRPRALRRRGDTGHAQEAGLIKSTRIDVKILGHGDLTKKLSVSAHLFSASAREKIEQAGGSITWIRGEPAPRPPKRRERKAAPPPAEEPEADEQTAEAEEVEEPPTDEPPPEGDES